MSALTFNQALEKLVAQRLRDRINELGVQIGGGKMPDYPAYKWHCGVVKGLQEAGDILEKALKDIQQAGRGDQASGKTSGS